MPNKIVGVFVDVARMYYSVNMIDKRNRINYEKYLQYAIGQDELHRAYAYGVQLNEEALPFIYALKGMGYEPKYKQAKIVKIDVLEKENLRLKQEVRALYECLEDETLEVREHVKNAITNDLPEYKPSIRETSWNLGLTMDIVRNIRILDHIVIGSNDPELVPLIEWIKEQGRRVTIFSFSIHRDLRAIADHCKELPNDVLGNRED